MATISPRSQPVIPDLRTAFQISTLGGLPLVINQFTYPDGQPHISIEAVKVPVVVQARIRNPTELFTLILANDALRAGGAPQVHLRILYLMGARMDRTMPPSPDEAHPPIVRYHPFTLAMVSDVLKTVLWDSISIFDPHSHVAPALLRATTENPVKQIKQALAALAPDRNNTDILIVSPDTGSATRLEAINPELGNLHITQCFKKRDMATGKLSGFKLLAPEDYPGRDCLIVDDLCDGGWTFTAIAELAIQAGARSINLYVSHGLFKKGYNLPNINRIFTTDSYCQDPELPAHVTVFSL